VAHIHHSTKSLVYTPVVHFTSITHVHKYVTQPLFSYFFSNLNVASPLLEVVNMSLQNQRTKMMCSRPFGGVRREE
jgi:hypothetical protein